MKLLICLAAMVAVSGQTAAPPASKPADKDPPLITTPIPRKWVLIAQAADGSRFYIDVWSVTRKSDVVLAGWEKRETPEGMIPGTTTTFLKKEYDCKDRTSKLLYAEAEMTRSKTLAKLYYGENQPWDHPDRGGPQEIIIDTVCKAVN